MPGSLLLLLPLLLGAPPVTPPDCYTAQDCSNHGDCVNGECSCHPGFNGPHCSVPFCSNRTSCSNHGNCTNLVCICDVGFSGPRCAQEKIACQHGGTPTGNGTNTTCTGCAGGWIGRDCGTWNSSSTAQDLVGFVDSVAAAHQKAMEELEKQVRVLPGRVGYGVDLLTLEVKTLPVVSLAYGNPEKVWRRYIIPEEAELTPFQSPEPVVRSYVWPTVADYAAAVDALSKEQTGRGGCFGFGVNWAKALYGSNGNDSAVSVSEMELRLYTLQLPFDPVTRAHNFTLSKYAKRALDGLPPSFGLSNASKAMYRAFVETYGTSYATQTVNGGMFTLPTLFDSWVTEATTIGGKPLTLPQLQARALCDFNRDTKTTLASCPAGTDDSFYRAHRTIMSEDMIAGGGDPTVSASANFTRWLATLQSSAGGGSGACVPVPVSFKLAAITDLVPDLVIRDNVQQAIDALMAEQRKAWATKDICPATCHKAGTCDKTAHAGRCTCHGSNVLGRECSTCAPGYTGLTSGCKKPTCSPKCSAAGGSCDAPNSCKCKAHFTGATCSKCLSGWSGSKCTTPVCDSPKCKAGYDCTAPNTCSPYCDRKCLFCFVCGAPDQCTDPVKQPSCDRSTETCHCATRNIHHPMTDPKVTYACCCDEVYKQSGPDAFGQVKQVASCCNGFQKEWPTNLQPGETCACCGSNLCCKKETCHNGFCM